MLVNPGMLRKRYSLTSHLLPLTSKLLSEANLMFNL